MEQSSNAPAAAPDHPPQSGEAPKRPLHKNPWFWGAVFGVAFVTAIRPFTRRVPEPPPKLFKLPGFSLIDQNGQPFGSDQLVNRTYLASFFFTSCPSICPKLTKAMVGLAARLDRTQSKIQLLSISVDGENDTPEKLRAYAKKYQADTPRWHFLTGNPKTVRELIEKGFKSHLGEKKKTAAGTFDIAHSGALALVDGEGFVRGFYGVDEQGIDEAFHRAGHVAKEPR